MANRFKRLRSIVLFNIMRSLLLMQIWVLTRRNKLLEELDNEGFTGGIPLSGLGPFEMRDNKIED